MRGKTTPLTLPRLPLPLRHPSPTPRLPYLSVTRHPCLVFPTSPSPVTHASSSLPLPCGGWQLITHTASVHALNPKFQHALTDASSFLPHRHQLVFLLHYHARHSCLTLPTPRLPCLTVTHASSSLPHRYPRLVFPASPLPTPRLPCLTVTHASSSLPHRYPRLVFPASPLPTPRLPCLTVTHASSSLPHRYPRLVFPASPSPTPRLPCLTVTHASSSLSHRYPRLVFPVSPLPTPRLPCLTVTRYPCHASSSLPHRHPCHASPCLTITRHPCHASPCLTITPASPPSMYVGSAMLGLMPQQLSLMQRLKTSIAAAPFLTSIAATNPRAALKREISVWSDASGSGGTSARDAMLRRAYGSQLDLTGKHGLASNDHFGCAEGESWYGGAREEQACQTTEDLLDALIPRLRRRVVRAVREHKLDAAEGREFFSLTHGWMISQAENARNEMKQDADADKVAVTATTTTRVPPASTTTTTRVPPASTTTTTRVPPAPTTTTTRVPPAPASTTTTTASTTTTATAFTTTTTITATAFTTTTTTTPTSTHLVKSPTTPTSTHLVKSPTTPTSTSTPRVKSPTTPTTWPQDPTAKTTTTTTTSTNTPAEHHTAATTSTATTTANVSTMSSEAKPTTTTTAVAATSPTTTTTTTTHREQQDTTPTITTTTPTNPHNHLYTPLTATTTSTPSTTHTPSQAASPLHTAISPSLPLVTQHTATPATSLATSQAAAVARRDGEAGEAKKCSVSGGREVLIGGMKYEGASVCHGASQGTGFGAGAGGWNGGAVPHCTHEAPGMVLQECPEQPPQGQNPAYQSEAGWTGQQCSFSPAESSGARGLGFVGYGSPLPCIANGGSGWVVTPESPTVRSPLAEAGAEGAAWGSEEDSEKLVLDGRPRGARRVEVLGRREARHRRRKVGMAARVADVRGILRCVAFPRTDRAARVSFDMPVAAMGQSYGPEHMRPPWPKRTDGSDGQQDAPFSILEESDAEASDNCEMKTITIRLGGGDEGGSGAEGGSGGSNGGEGSGRGGLINWRPRLGRNHQALPGTPDKEPPAPRPAPEASELVILNLLQDSRRHKGQGTPSPSSPSTEEHAPRHSGEPSLDHIIIPPPRQYTPAAPPPRQYTPAAPPPRQYTPAGPPHHHHHHNHLSAQPAPFTPTTVSSSSSSSSSSSPRAETSLHEAHHDPSGAQSRHDTDDDTDDGSTTPIEEFFLNHGVRFDATSARSKKL
ncbi:hypothetical protein GWK47_047576 [Chionoecetes opilio]|uniref:Uncharacterized protein n=1 Tax=Chionoecetes opilio TaxID=41210 RepID=A0A8J4Y4K4_CHIOP|nr:hypothetical protein GWK47_047576 [Chionoecetes opilio]